MNSQAQTMLERNDGVFLIEKKLREVSVHFKVKRSIYGV